MTKEPVIKWCNTCSRTFQHAWPKEEVCESWAPDIYATEAIANGAEVLTWEEYHEQMKNKIEREISNAE